MFYHSSGEGGVLHKMWVQWFTELIGYDTNGVVSSLDEAERIAMLLNQAWQHESPNA